jgi:hypothetical protein
MSEELKLQYAIILVAQAVAIHGTQITPAANFSRFRDSLTVFRGSVMLWYNYEKNTSIVKTDINILNRN